MVRVHHRPQRFRPCPLGRTDEYFPSTLPPSWWAAQKLGSRGADSDVQSIRAFSELKRSFMRFRVLTLLSLLSAVAFSQTASITGRVTDAGGAVVPDATVTVRSTTS